jgi:hypothetical protein
MKDYGACYDCGRRYGDKYGFSDLIIPDSVWLKISPTGNDGGLLCPSCICKRLVELGLTCSGTFASGPLRSKEHKIEYEIDKLKLEGAELLDALEIAKSIIDEYIEVPIREGYSEIEDAIKKARGEE